MPKAMPLSKIRRQHPYQQPEKLYRPYAGCLRVLEAMVAIRMMQEGWFHPTLNLDDPDPRRAELDYIMADGRNIAAEHVMSNNFAFGGINTSLIFRRWRN